MMDLFKYLCIFIISPNFLNTLQPSAWFSRLGSVKWCFLVKNKVARIATKHPLARSRKDKNIKGFHGIGTV